MVLLAVAYALVEEGFTTRSLFNPNYVGQHLLAYGGNHGPGHADVEEIDLSSGQTHTLTISNPVIDGAITTFAW